MALSSQEAKDISTRQGQRKAKKMKKRKALESCDEHSDDNAKPIRGEESGTILNRESSLSSSFSAIPARDCSSLFASPVTVSCALEHRCVPCAYKVGCFDVALDHEFCQRVPNQRPESCPRASKTIGSPAPATNKMTVQKSGRETRQHESNSWTFSSSSIETKEGFETGVLGYCPGMRVLTCGDGDFSFSLALARLFLSSTFSTTIGLVASSYEDRETLQRVYPGVDDTIAELERMGVTGESI
jgi:hypothetical protein